jgi:hypothetical protein
MSELGTDSILEPSLNGTDMGQMRKYQQQFRAGFLFSPEKREMTNVVNLTSERDVVMNNVGADQGD